MVAQLGVPDRRCPSNSLTYPRRMPSPAGELDLCALGKLTFIRRIGKRPLPGICREALRRGGLVPAAANGANEQAVALFLEGKIGFLDIPGWWRPPWTVRIPAWSPWKRFWKRIERHGLSWQARHTDLKEMVLCRF